MTDDKALLRCQEGDREAFRHVVEGYADSLLGTAYLMTGNAAQAEEHVQEAFLNAWRGIKRFQRGGALEPWLMRALVTAVLTGQRTRPPATMPIGESAPPGSPSGQHEAPEASTDRQAVRDALARLSPEHRQVVVLRYFSDFSVGEAARVAGVREGTVRSRLHRALRHMRELLEQSGATEWRATARGDAPDHEMERRLMEHFSLEGRALRVPEDLWERLEVRLDEQDDPRRAFPRNVRRNSARGWTAAIGKSAWAPAAAAALLVGAVAIGAWVFGSGGGDPSTPEVVTAPATSAPATPTAVRAAPTPTVMPLAAPTAPRPAPTPPATAASTAARTLAPTPVAAPGPLAEPTAAPAAAPTAAPTPGAARTATPAPGERDAEAAPAAGAADDAIAEAPGAASDSDGAMGDGSDGPAESGAPDERAEAPESSFERSHEAERRPAALSAGEVDDNERWDEYVHYRDSYSGPPIHDVDVAERYVITVTDTDGRPLHDARVRVSAAGSVLFEGRTYANGRTLFFPRAFEGGEGAESFTLLVEADAASEQIEFTRGEDLDWDVTLDVTRTAREGGVPLDILFLLDATGSMEDEIEQIKDTLLSISSRISDLPSQPDVRLGMVAYRDRGEAWVTRVFDFEPDAARFLETIRGVVAHGGGDDPESLNEALHAAVHEPGWRLEEDAVRLMFLIADAPPHLDYVEDYSYADEMIEAHRRGIKIFSIASSGLDEQGEYIFRQIAQHTMGRFLFIVYGAGGTTPHSVGEYSVERLDDLVVSLVEDELALLDR